MDEDIKDTLEEYFKEENFDVKYIRKNYFMVSKQKSSVRIFFNYNPEYTYMYNLEKLIKLISKIMVPLKEVKQ